MRYYYYYYYGMEIVVCRAQFHRIGALRTAMSSKRKHTTLTIEAKHEIIKLLDRGERVNALAARFGVGRATVYDILRSRDRIEEFVAGRRAEAGRRQTLKRGEFPGVEEALYAWYVRRRRRDDGPVSAAALACRALSVHRHQLQVEGGGGGGGGGATFKASVGWLNKFKKRYGILRTGDGDETHGGCGSSSGSSSDHDGGPSPRPPPPPAVAIHCDDDGGGGDDDGGDDDGGDDDGGDDDDDDDERTTETKYLVTARGAETVPTSTRTAVDSFDECIAWARENGIPARDLRVLKELRDKASAQQQQQQQSTSPDRNNV